MTSEIDKLKHFHVENYNGTNFTDDLNDGEEFLYTTIRCKDDWEEDFMVLITVLELLKIQKPLYLKMVDLLVILV